MPTLPDGTLLATSDHLRLASVVNDPDRCQADLELTCPNQSCHQESLISMIGNRYDGRMGDLWIRNTSGAILTCPNSDCAMQVGVVNPLFNPTIYASMITDNVNSSRIKEFDISESTTWISKDSAWAFYNAHQGYKGPKILPDIVFFGHTRTNHKYTNTNSMETIKPHFRITQYALSQSTALSPEYKPYSTLQPDGEPAEIDVVPTFLGYEDTSAHNRYDGVYTYKVAEGGGEQSSSTLLDIDTYGIPTKFTYN
ncbi:hypothetical protein V866_005309 [Kwoniella sp. B9012]|uniref:Uncharacterized protein n=1 Tax=Kwoniella europaea PYCC6329 TaxID=1423913 RepID=A0AAX4KL72_9TREE